MSSSPTLTFAASRLLRHDDGRLYLVHRPHYDNRSLPKGKPEPDETPVETAIKEIRGKTRCKVDCGRFAGRCGYRVPDDTRARSGPKGVFIWHMRIVDGHQSEPDAEVDARQWVTPVGALQQLTYETERALVRQASELNE